MLTDEQRRQLEAWVLAVGPSALSYARSLVRDVSQAEDVVQECLYRLLRRAENYNFERDGIKLLFKSISNLCINQATREKAIVSLDSDGGFDDGPIPVLDRVTLQPDRVLQLRELEDQVRDSLEKLPTLQRAALELRALGMSKDEIGEALAVSATHAGVLVYRARRALEGHLGLVSEEKPVV